MFTGLIEDVGRVVEISPRRGSTRIGIRTKLPPDGSEQGASIAVDGVCLTVVDRRGDRFHADVVQETLSRSTLGELRAGQEVNLERSLALGARLGGHLVAGHVDGTTDVEAVRRRGDDYRIRLRTPPALDRYIAFKGSISWQGVSLTVAQREAGSHEAALIPETLARTTLGRLRAGDRVNLEVDLLARYLERLMAGPGPGAATGGQER